MPRMQGNSVTIGGQTNNYFFIDWSTVDEPSNNRTLVYWAAYFHFTLADSQLDNGSAVLNGTRWANGGRVYNFASNFTTRDLLLANSSFYVDHNGSGEATLSVSGGITLSGGSRSSGSTSVSLTNYTRVPNTPSQPSFVSRDRTNMSVSTSATVPSGAPGVSSYTWQVSTNASTWTTISGQSGSTLNYVAPSATTQYYFRALATNTEGNSSYSIASPIVAGAPSQPSAPGITRTGKNLSVSLSTPDSNGSTLSTFTLDYSTASNFPEDSSTITISGINSSTQAINDLDPGQTYYLRYKVGSNRGNSDLSPISNITIPQIPAAPEITTALTKQVRKVTVDWNPITLNGASLTSYLVEARFSSDGGSTWDNSFTQLGTTNSSTTIFTTSDLNIAKTYQFRIGAITDVGNTPYSDIEDLTAFNSIFISAYGYRNDGTNFNTAIQFAARYTGNSEDTITVSGTTYTGWKTIENVKRYDGTEFISLTQ
jgi:hypothetical protein